MPISAGRPGRTITKSMPCCGIRQIDGDRRHPRGWFNLGVQGCRHLVRVTTMRSSLDHLPQHKQRELERIVRSDERRTGKEGVSTIRFRWVRYYKKKKKEPHKA